MVKDKGQLPLVVPSSTTRVGKVLTIIAIYTLHYLLLVVCSTVEVIPSSSQEVSKIHII